MLNIETSKIICIDLQDKLINIAPDKELIKNNSIKLLKAAAILNIDTIITEQYPKGLGTTLDDIKNIKDFKTLEKTTFSAIQTQSIKEELKDIKNKNFIVFGIETHICVYQTVLDLIDNGANVFVVCDCCASRNILNHNTALDLMKQKGAKITTLEIVLFEWLKSSKHPNFKEIQGLIK